MSCAIIFDHLIDKLGVKPGVDSVLMTVWGTLSSSSMLTI